MLKVNFRSSIDLSERLHTRGCLAVLSEQLTEDVAPLLQIYTLCGLACAAQMLVCAVLYCGYAREVYATYPVEHGNNSYMPDERLDMDKTMEDVNEDEDLSQGIPVSEFCYWVIQKNK